jgi:hypothetical protein
VAADDVLLRTGLLVAGLAVLTGSLMTTQGSGLGGVPAFVVILVTNTAMVMLVALLGRSRNRRSLMDLSFGLSCLNMSSWLFAWQRLAGVSHMPGAALLIVAIFVGIFGCGITWSGARALHSERMLLATPGGSPRTPPTGPRNPPAPLSPAERWAMTLGLAAVAAATGACLWAALVA